MRCRSSSRIASVDFLRGAVMVVMALDHTRGMVGNATFDAMDLTRTYPALFLTRWITHFCAPVFVFLAGTSAFLSTARGKSRSELSRFLWTRGLWLIVLELTLVRFGWSFRLASPVLVGQVIWALGWSMIVLAVLIYLPVSVVALVGIAMIASHNLLDGVQAKSFGAFAWLWGILHGGYHFQVAPGVEFIPIYPLVPWIGVMAAGYGFGYLLLLDQRARRQKLFWLGLGLTGAFMVIRAANVYGDPQPWSMQKDFVFTCFSFVNCTKYPPSLLFLLMTLGPAILLLSVFDWAGVGQGVSLAASVSETVNLQATAPIAIPPPHEVRSRRGNESLISSDKNETRYLVSYKLEGDSRALNPEPETQNSKLAWLTRPFIVFGRVPMFYYLLHLPLIHLLAVVVAYPQYKAALGSFYFTHPPSGYGHDLWVVYVVWIAAVLLLYPLCRWFAGVKQRRREAWLSYL